MRKVLVLAVVAFALAAGAFFFWTRRTPAPPQALVLHGNVDISAMVVRWLHRYRACLPGVVAFVMVGCASGAPTYVKPEPQAPPDWMTWRSGDASLHEPLDTSETLPENWWAAFSDPLLDELQHLAIQASPDLKTAALHFAQARVLNSQRGLLQARFDKASSEGRLLVRFVAINRALGNAPKLVQ